MSQSQTIAPRGRDTGADQTTFVRGGSTLTAVFLVDERIDDPNTTKSGSFRWWADDGPTLNAGLVAL